MQCPNCNAELALVLAPVDGTQTHEPRPNVIGGGNTHIVDVGSQQGPYEGTGRDTSITPLSDRAKVDLPPMTSKNFRVPVGAVVALAINVPAGDFTDMGFRAGLGEYGDAGNAVFDLALSRSPWQIEGAPARDPKNIAWITFANDPAQLFSPGEWYLNVRVNQAGAQGAADQGFTISWYGPHDSQ